MAVVRDSEKGLNMRPISDLLPFEHWPEAARAAWESGAPAWSRERAMQVRREYARLLAWLADNGGYDQPLTTELLITYGTWLRRRSPGRPGLERLSSLIYALLVVQPEVSHWDFQQAVDGWSREYSEEHRGRPARPGNRTLRPRGYSLSYAAWPDDERQRWADATRSGGKYLGGGPLSGYRPATIKGYRDTYALWLGFLNRSGCQRSDHDERSFDAFVTELEGRMKSGIAAAVVGRLRKVLEALYPALDTTCLRRHRRRLSGRNEERPSKLPRLEHPGRIADAGERLIIEARKCLRRKKAALLFRDGLLLMLLAHRPARISNVQAIRSGTELDLETPGGRLAWKPDQTKNRVNLSFSLTPELIHLMREWLDEFRPVLATEESGDSFWIALSGKPLLVSGLRQAILKRTEQQLGKQIPPHLFRDCLATMIALERPERVDDVSALLGQRRPDSKDGYIAVAKSIIAQRQRQDLEVEARRKRGRKQLSFRSAGRQR